MKFICTQREVHIRRFEIAAPDAEHALRLYRRDVLTVPGQLPRSDDVSGCELLQITDHYGMVHWPLKALIELPIPETILRKLFRHDVNTTQQLATAVQTSRLLHKPFALSQRQLDFLREMMRALHLYPASRRRKTKAD